MPNTIQLTIPVTDPQVREQIIAKCSDAGFEAFEETDNALHAFIAEEAFSKSEIDSILSAHHLGYEQILVEEQNWNALWESNFQPVVVGSFCAIRADFHQPFTEVQHEIIITPKMSFGTGHHATTYMMVQEMSKLSFDQKTVADFGTRTGVLAILAEKMNAAGVYAIDYDDWSIENASENLERNNCTKVDLQKADTFNTDHFFDIILANINRNVILDNLSGLVKSLRKGSQLLLSGLLKTDEADIIAAVEAHGLRHKKTEEKNNWVCILFEYGSISS